MRIAVVGVGGVGGPFGAALAQAGHDVHFIARGAHLEAMKADGLRIRGARGDTTIKPVQATSDPGEIGPVDIVLFTVKLWDVEAAGATLAPLLGPETGVICLQNGIDSETRLAGVIGAKHVIGGVALIGAHIGEPGVITQVGTIQKLIFGELDNSRSTRCAAFLEACQSAGFDAEHAEDIQRALWQKFVFLVSSSSATALTRQTIGVIRDDPDMRFVLKGVMEETLAVGQAEGVDLADNLVADRMAYIDTMPPEGRTSMANDLLRGNRLELPWLAGCVNELGRKHGVPVPVTRTVVGALKAFTDGQPSS